MTYDNRHHQFLTQYNHKLFAHVNGWNNDVIDYIATVRPKIVKFLDPNLSSVEAVRELVPDALLIYRHHLDPQPLGNSEGEANQLGIEFGQLVASEAVVQSGLVNLVEGYNEILGETVPASEHRKYAQFQLGFQAGLGNAPVEPIAFNFGTGNMDADLLMSHYGNVLISYNWLGFHEYDWPFMSRLHEQGLADGNEGMWLALRYRRIMQPIIERLGDNWSVLITECGMTQGVLAGQDVGYLHPQNTIQGDWGDYPTPISSDDYWDALRWYSDELMKNDYVAGACMFVTGALSPWETFETVGNIIPKIAEFQEVVSNGSNGMSDIFVNDVRVSDDASLELVPRIETFEGLQQAFGLEVNISQGKAKANDGERYWQLVGFEVRTGIAAYLPQVKTMSNDPAPNIIVFRHWPDAPPFASPVDPGYFSNGVGDFTNQDGIMSFGYGGGSVTDEDGGPDYIWPSADPLGGDRIASDMASKLGWIGGTDHLTANPIFQDVMKGSEPPPPGNGGGNIDNTIKVIVNGETVYLGKFKVVVEQVI